MSLTNFKDGNILGKSQSGAVVFSYPEKKTWVDALMNGMTMDYWCYQQCKQDMRLRIREKLTRKIQQVSRPQRSTPQVSYCMKLCSQKAQVRKTKSRRKLGKEQRSRHKVSHRVKSIIVCEEEDEDEDEDEGLCVVCEKRPVYWYGRCRECDDLYMYMTIDEEWYGCW